MSLQNTMEDKFIFMQQGKMSVLDYASKFMELSHFAPAYVADEKLRMNHFVAGVNRSPKEWTSIQYYASYKDMNDIAINVEKVMKERNELYNEQRGVKRSGD